jgi:hypothetical protein
MLVHQEEGVMRESRVRFIRQQGFATQRADEQLYTALMLQPRIIGAGKGGTLLKGMQEVRAQRETKDSPAHGWKNFHSVRVRVHHLVRTALHSRGVSWSWQE